MENSQDFVRELQTRQLDIQIRLVRLEEQVRSLCSYRERQENKDSRVPVLLIAGISTTIAAISAAFQMWISSGP